jgi:hypothetical protein
MREQSGRPLYVGIAERGKYVHDDEGIADWILGTEPRAPLDAEGVPPGVGVMLHELVHRAEYSHEGITGAEWSFYESRTAPTVGSEGSPLVPLRELTGVDSYRPDEATRPDDFIEPYSGKQYVGDDMTRPYEILTTGIEDLVTGRHGIIEADPEYRQFVYGALATL